MQAKNILISRSYKLSLEIIKLCDKLPNSRSSWIIADQLTRSATSIGANLVEATASSSRREFKKFHEISLKSVNESKYWLGLLRDSGKIGSDKIEPLLDETNQLSKMIAAGILKMKGKTRL